jgi:hypothetical protein
MPKPNPFLITSPAWLLDWRPQLKSPWAVLLCKFKDTPQSSPTPKSLYQRLFTTAGVSTFNAIQYFRDMSHGMLDLSGSQVFDGIAVDANLNDYTAPSDPPPPGWVQTMGRGELTKRVREAALAAGITLQDFWGDVIIFNVAIGGAFGSAGVPFSASAQDRPYACSDFRSTSMAIYGHEMGHAYGLNHSRIDGSSDDYRDPWDIMSALATYFGPDADFGTRGPGLNAANMRALGWLNDTRVWRPDGAAYNQVLQLRPLHRRDLPGLLAAEFSTSLGGFIVEYRKAEGWDVQFPRSAVMVHRYALGNSYIMPGTDGRLDLSKGERFQPWESPFAPKLELRVIDINDATSTATVQISSSPGAPLPHTFPQTVIGQVPVDGPGGVIVNGRFIPIPPWNPMAQLLAGVAELPSREDATQTLARNALTRQLLVQMSARIAEMIAEIDSFGGPERLPPTVLGRGRIGLLSQAQSKAGKKKAKRKPR